MLEYLKYINVNFDDYTNEDIIEHNSKWPYIPDHQYRIFIIGGSGSGKTNEYHVLVLKLTDKLDLRRGQKTVALSNPSIYYTWKTIKSSYNDNKFKISAPTWNKEFELPDGSY